MNLDEVLKKLMTKGLADITVQDVAVIIGQAQEMLDRNRKLTRELGDLQEKYNTLAHTPSVELPPTLRNCTGTITPVVLVGDERTITLTFDAEKLALDVRFWSGIEMED